MLESIKKLREFVADINECELNVQIVWMHNDDCSEEVYIKPDFVSGWHRAVDKVIDDLEREIERDYMLLPVDADGVPWNLTDKEFIDPQGNNKGLRQIIFNIATERWELLGSDSYVSVASKCRHVKSDSLEKLLDDVSKGVICYPRERVTGYLEDNHSIGEAVMLDVRDRLRDLLGDDAE